MSHPYIQDILTHLNAEEKKSLLHYFQLLNAQSDETKSIAFLKGLFGEDPRYDGGKTATDTIRSRVFEKSIDAFLQEKHISKENLHNEHAYEVFRLKKRLLHFRILLQSLNQGRINSLRSMLNSIINDAKKHEVYDVMIEALVLKKYFVGLRSGNKEFEKINEEVLAAEKTYKSVLFASDSYYRLTMSNNLLTSYSKEEFKKYLSATIKKLKKDHQETGSLQINYYMHLIFLIFYERNKKYNLAIKYCKELIDLIANSKVIYRKERIGFALDNLSQYKTFVGKFYEAARSSKEAQTYYSENSFNFVASKGQEFHVYFYHGKYDKALKCASELLEITSSNAGKFRRDKFVYYQASSYFALGNYKSALTLLQSSMEIEKDKGGWNVALRILIIMIFIELDKTDQASVALESLRKSVERTTKTAEVTERDVLIVKALRALEKGSFRFNVPDPALAKILQKLSQKDKSFSWEYYLPELIPFHSWLKGKMNSK